METGLEEGESCQITLTNEQESILALESAVVQYTGYDLMYEKFDSLGSLDAWIQSENSD